MIATTNTQVIQIVHLLLSSFLYLIVILLILVVGVSSSVLEASDQHDLLNHIQPRSYFVPNINYGNNHPWEKQHNIERSLLYKKDVVSSSTSTTSSGATTYHNDGHTTTTTSSNSYNTGSNTRQGRQRKTTQQQKEKLFVTEYKSPNHETKPIRITFYTDFVLQKQFDSTLNNNKEEKSTEGMDNSNNSLSSVINNVDHSNPLLHTTTSKQEENEMKQMKVLLEDILPRASKFWSNAIQVIPVQGKLRLNLQEDETSSTTTDSTTSTDGRSSYSNCPYVEQHTMDGIDNADLMIYLYAQTQCSGSSTTSTSTSSSSSSTTTTTNNENIVLGRSSSSSSNTPSTFGFPCELDQYDRPIGGTLNICLDILEFNRIGDISQHIVDKVYVSVIRQIGNILGIHPTMYKFFRNSLTGQPLTPRPFKESRVECVGGGTGIVQMPSCNTIQQDKTSPKGILYYQIVTPTVRSVIQNHFDCIHVKGARLENQHSTNNIDESSSSNSKQQQHCLGYEWETRWFNGELMSPIHTSSTHILSPLTLALLEDSGWYKANYTASQTLSYGHKAGCQFLFNDCIVDSNSNTTTTTNNNDNEKSNNNDLLETTSTTEAAATTTTTSTVGDIPSYGKDFFCNTLLKQDEFVLSTSQRICDSTYTHKSFCDLVDYNDPYFGSIHGKPTKPYSYFEQNDSYGSLTIERDYCPSALNDNSIDCTNIERSPLVKVSKYELYSKQSRCFHHVTKSSNKEVVSLDPICLQATCNEQRFELNIQVGNNTYTCGHNDEGTLINLIGSNSTIDNNVINEGSSYFICPSLSTACPDLFCYKNCRGRGYCNTNTNECECFNEEDITYDCSLTKLQEPIMNIESCGGKLSSSGISTFVSFCSTIVTVVAATMTLLVLQFI